MNWGLFLQSIPDKYKRIVAHGEYNRKVDGIRFIAIISVVLCHIHSYTFHFGNYKIHAESVEERWIYNLFQGICLFFVLSGYILSNALFQAKNENKKFDIKAYYLRRITRIEPAYFIVLIFSFLIFVFVLNKFSFQELLPHLISSFFYSNNFFYPHTHPIVMKVAWTLEVEVQFYILLPIFFYLYNLNLRWSRIIALIIIFAIPFGGLHHSINFHTTLYYQLPYFLAGILLADLLNNEKKIITQIQLPSLFANSIAVICLLLMWGINYYDYPTYFRPDVMPVIILLFYFLIFTQNVFEGFFNNRWIAFIGGMCYSLYLTHYLVISFLGKSTIHFKLTEYYLLNYFLQIILLLPFILVVGFIFYRIVELPTMQKSWVQNLINNFRNNNRNKL